VNASNPVITSNHVITSNRVTLRKCGFISVISGY